MGRATNSRQTVMEESAAEVKEKPRRKPARKRGGKKAIVVSSEENNRKKEQQKEQNRANARLSRRKHKEYVSGVVSERDDLQFRVEALQKELASLHQERSTEALARKEPPKMGVIMVSQDQQQKEKEAREALSKKCEELATENSDLKAKLNHGSAESAKLAAEHESFKCYISEKEAKVMELTREVQNVYEPPATEMAPMVADVPQAGNFYMGSNSLFQYFGDGGQSIDYGYSQSFQGEDSLEDNRKEAGVSMINFGDNQHFFDEMSRHAPQPEDMFMDEIPVEDFDGENSLPEIYQPVPSDTSVDEGLRKFVPHRRSMRLALKTSVVMK